MDNPEDLQDDSFPSLYSQNLLSILGEKVSLVPIDEVTKQGNIVFFDEYYVPKSFSKEEKEYVREAFQKMFSGVLHESYDLKNVRRSSPRVSFQTFPPCDAKLKQLVLNSFIYRKQLLRQQLKVLGIRTPQDLAANLQQGVSAPEQYQQTLETKSAIYHYYTLNTFLNEYDKFQECMDVGTLGEEGLEEDQEPEPLELSENQIQQILQQVVFFILQNKHPEEEYKSVNPKTVLQQLSKNPLGERFQTFMKSYAAKQPISPRLEAVISAIETGDSDLAKAFQDSAEDVKQLLLEEIRKQITDPEDPLLTPEFANKPLGDMFVDILKRLSESEDKTKVLEAEKIKLEGEVLVVKKEMKDLALKYQALRSELDQKEQELLAFDADEKKKDTLNKLKIQLNEDFSKKYLQLKDSSQNLMVKITQLESELKDISVRNQTLEQTIVSLQEELLKEKKDRASEKAILENKLSKCEQERSLLAERVTTLQKEKADAEQALKVSQEELEQKEKERVDAESQLRNKEQELTALQEQLRTSQQANQTIQAELTNTQEKVGELNETIRDLSKQIGENEEENEGLEEEVEGLKLEKQGFEEKIKQLENEKKSYEEQIGQLTQSIQAGKSDLEKEQSALSAFTKEVDILKASVARLEQELETAKANYTSAQDQYVSKLQAKDSEINALKEQLQKLQADIGQQKSQYETSLKEKDTAIQQKQAEIQQKDSLITQLQKEKNEIQVSHDTTMKEIEQEINKANEQIAELKKTVETGERSLQTQQEDIVKLQAQIEVLNKQREEEKRKCEEALAAKEAEIVKRLDEKDAIIKELADEKAVLSLDLAGKDVELQSLKGQLEEKEVHITKKEEELTSLKGKAESHEKKIAELSTNVESLEGQLDQLKSQNEGLTKELSLKGGQASQLSSTIQENNAKIEELTKRITENEVLLKQLGIEKQSLVEKQKRCEEELNRVKQEVESLKQALEQEKTSHSSTQEELEETKKRLADLEKNLGDTQARLTSLQAEKEGKEKQIVNLKSNIESYAKEIEKYTQEIQRITQAFEQQLSNLSQETQNAIRRILAEKETQKQQYEEAMKKEREAYERFIQSLRDTAERRVNDVTKEKQDLEREMDALQKNLQIQLDSAQEKIIALDKSLKEVTTKMIQKEKLLTITVYKLSNTEQQLKEEEQKFQSQKETIQRLEKEKADLQEKLNSSTQFNTDVVLAIQTVYEWMKKGDISSSPTFTVEGPSQEALEGIVGLFKKAEQYKLDKQINNCAFVFLFAFLWESHFGKESIQPKSFAEATTSSSTQIPPRARPRSGSNVGVQALMPNPDIRVERQDNIVRLYDTVINTVNPDARTLVSLFQYIISFLRNVKESDEVLPLDKNQLDLLNLLYSTMISSGSSTFKHSQTEYSRGTLAQIIENNFMDTSRASVKFRRLFFLRAVDPLTKLIRYKSFIRGELIKPIASALGTREYISFFEIFYFYMFAIRKFLNATQQEESCPLPAFLQTSP